MRQIAADFTILQRAYYTRLMGSDEEKDALSQADMLAQHALTLAIKSNLIHKDTTVLTYFQKTGFVRVIPYASVAIIGIPVTCVDRENNFRDFLSIPHEIGHYVYWHARFNNEPVEPEEDTRLSYFVHEFTKEYGNGATRCLLPQWQEDIFADVYGCLVAGPAIALQFQELLFDNYTLTESDGEHPIPLMRPDIYTKVLEIVSFKDDEQKKRDFSIRLGGRSVMAATHPKSLLLITMLLY